MRWNWEELTSPDFAQAVTETGGVCVLPIGINERHGGHLPVGTDTLIARTVAELAAAREPAIIFPPYYFGQTHETKNRPGAIAIRHELQFALLENVCDEIARNGMHKIILLNGHGGNEFLLPSFMWTLLERPHDYTAYIVRLGDYYHLQDNEAWQRMMVSEYDWHAGEIETSAVLAAAPDLVRMEQLTAPGVPRKRLAHLPKMLTASWWYADFPDQYAGDASAATREKGEYLLNHFASKVAAIIKAVREDTVAPELEKQFFAEVQH